MTMYEKLNGKQLEVKYETGAHYRMTYLSENELKWEALSEVAEGEAVANEENTEEATEEVVDEAVEAE